MEFIMGTMQTRVKICGITSVGDALMAVEQGASAIGLVFYAGSPRNVAVEVAKEIAITLPPFVSVVGLFVNASRTEIEAISAQVKLDVIQFHGDETPADCEQISLPYIKAIRVKPGTNLVQCALDFSGAKAILLDTYSDAAYGGTGLVFDWKLIPQTLTKPIILAGGLNAQNVVLAINEVQPYAVDVSGGVELRKGIKDPAKVVEFMQAVRKTRSY
jgi:phosphoribosylanthranilate isomerase